MRALSMFFVIALASCMPTTPYFPPNARSFANNDVELYAINALAETASVIDVESLTMHHDVFATGHAPNALAYYDGTLYVANSLDNEIMRIDDETFAPRESIYLGRNKNPWTIVIDTNTPRAFVPNFIAGTVSVINLASREIEREITVGAGPQRSAILGAALYVGNTAWDNATAGFLDGTVSVIDLDSLTVIATIAVEKNPQDVVAIPLRNEIHVVCTGRNASSANESVVVVIDGDTKTVVDRIEIGGAMGAVAYHEASDVVYLAGLGSVRAYRASTRETLPRILESDSLYSGLAVDDDRLYVVDFAREEIIALDRASGTRLATLKGSDGVQSLFYVKKN